MDGISVVWDHSLQEEAICQVYDGVRSLKRWLPHVAPLSSEKLSFDQDEYSSR